MEKYEIGYTQGTFDLFHIGHLNLLNNAKKMCNHLIVGVNSDNLVKDYKNKSPIINEENRAKIVQAIKGIDEVFIANTLDKKEILKSIKFNAIFIGDDWKNNERWIKTKQELEKLNIDTIFLPYTEGISTTMIRKLIDKR